MIEAANDYSPFWNTKKVKALKEGKEFFQELWLAIAGVHDDLLTYSEEVDLINTINSTRGIINGYDSKLQEVYAFVWDKK